MLRYLLLTTLAMLTVSAQAIAPAPVKSSATGCTANERGRVYTNQGRRTILVPQEYSNWVRHYARSQGIPEPLLFSLIWHESGFCQNAVSSAGAIGLGQLMPGTAAELGVDPYHPQQNIAGSARYLGNQLRRFQRVELALAAYNAGPGRVSSCMCVPPIPETQAYVRNILSMYRSFYS